MLLRERGHVVQVGPALANCGIPLQAAYCGAKDTPMQGSTETVTAEPLHGEKHRAGHAVHMPAMNTSQFTGASRRRRTPPAADAD